MTQKTNPNFAHSINNKPALPPRLVRRSLGEVAAAQLRSPAILNPPFSIIMFPISEGYGRLRKEDRGGLARVTEPQRRTAVKGLPPMPYSAILFGRRARLNLKIHT
jgi:hypothetical protein